MRDSHKHSFRSTEFYANKQKIGDEDTLDTLGVRFERTPIYILDFSNKPRDEISITMMFLDPETNAITEQVG